MTKTSNLHFNDENFKVSDLKHHELVNLLKHLKLGQAHLKSTLPHLAYKHLLQQTSLSKKQLHSLKTDDQEKTGNVSLIFHMILTAVLSVWFGLASFGHLQLKSYITLIIVVLSIGLGLWVSHLSYKLTKKQAIEAINDQKLNNMQLEITDMIITKRNALLKSLQDSITKLLHHLGLQPFSAKMSLSRLHNFAASLLHNLPSDDISNFYSQKFTALENSIEKLQARIISLNKKDCEKDVSVDVSSPSEEDLLLNNSMTNASYLKILITANHAYKKPVVKLHYWLKNNVLAIMVGLMPTVLGGMASMFVFLNGIPALLAEYEILRNINADSWYGIKGIGLLLCVLITIYFGYSHIHSNFKNFRRSKELETLEQKIISQEEKMTQIQLNLRLYTKLFHQLKEFADLVQTLKFVTNPKSTH